MRFLQVCGSDTRMDCLDNFTKPINQLPPKCAKCGFYDLDHIPQPYFLNKSRAMAPQEMASAHTGNFLVRDRIRQVLEVVLPSACRFYPTTLMGSNAPSGWSLAVPVIQEHVANVASHITRCSECGEPRAAHPGTEWEWLLGYPWEAAYDIFKSREWGSTSYVWASKTYGWQASFYGQDLYLSDRFYTLLEVLGAKGLDEQNCGPSTRKTRLKEHKAWIDEQVARLQAAGIPLQPTDTLKPEDARWLKDFLARHAASPAPAFDRKAEEKRLEFKIPSSMADFQKSVGQMTFHEVDGIEGFTVHLLPSANWDPKIYWQHGADAEDENINGVVIAMTDHGDCFCLDVRKDRREYAIYLFNHELSCFELYADNFAACLRRWAG